MSTTGLDPVHTDVLGNAAWASLTRPHRRCAEGWPEDGSVPLALRYPKDVSPFVAVGQAEPDAETWAALAALGGPGGSVALSGGDELFQALPAGWATGWKGEGVQLLSTDALLTAPDDEAVLLGM